MSKRNGKYRGPRGPQKGNGRDCDRRPAQSRGPRDCENQQDELVQRNRRGLLPPMEHIRQDELQIEGNFKTGDIRVGRRDMSSVDVAATNHEASVNGKMVVHASGQVPENVSRQMHPVLDRFFGEKGNKVGATLVLQPNSVLLSRTTMPTADVQDSMGRQQRQIIKQRRQGNSSVPPPPGPEPGKVCVACGIRGHMGKNCVMSSSRGDLPVCSFCDTFRIHLPEDCPQKFIDAAVVWDLFVVQRQGKCEIRTKEPTLMWPNLVRWRLDDYPSEAQLALYPHSREFAKQQNEQNLYRHRAHDYTLEPRNLVSDPRTKDRETLLADAALRRDYPAPQAEGMDTADLAVDTQGTTGFDDMDEEPAVNPQINSGFDNIDE